MHSLQTLENCVSFKKACLNLNGTVHCQNTGNKFQQMRFFEYTYQYTKMLVISFRGTSMVGFEDLFEDILATTDRFFIKKHSVLDFLINNNIHNDPCSTVTHFAVHGGFYRTACCEFDKLRNTSYLKCIKKVLLTEENTKIMICGHSLGAGLSIVTYFLLLNNLKYQDFVDVGINKILDRIIVIAVATPQSVEKCVVKKLNSHKHVKIVNLVACNDVVPLINLKNCKEFLREVVEDCRKAKVSQFLRLRVGGIVTKKYGLPSWLEHPIKGIAHVAQMNNSEVIASNAALSVPGSFLILMGNNKNDILMRHKFVGSKNNVSKLIKNVPSSDKFKGNKLHKPGHGLHNCWFVNESGMICLIELC